MSESDSDYCDVGNSVDDGSNDARDGGRKVRTNEEGVKVRGTDVEWVQVATFNDKEAFDASDIKAKLDKQFSRRKSRAFDYGDFDNYVCMQVFPEGWFPDLPSQVQSHLPVWLI